MIKYNFEFIKKPTECDEFADASAVELKVLVALFESGGSISDDELIAVSGTSRSRVASAIALWQEAGVIGEKSGEAEVSFFGNKVTHEFSERISPDELREETAKEVAVTIRDNKLASLFDECARMMNKLMLTPQEIRRLSELSSQYALSDEYILTLAAHLCEAGNLSVGILVKRAMTLAGEGIVTADALAQYIAEKEARRDEFIEYRRIFGIYNRSFSSKEKELLDKWSREFSYGTEIVGMAYDITVMNTSKLSFVYMDKLLCDWHENGAKTLSECEKRYIERKAELDKAAEVEREKTSKRRPEKASKPAKRYGDFDPEEAFKLALSRSFSGDED